MVKNKIGGNRAKKGARKNLNEGAGLMMRKLRMIEDDDEKYGIVTKMIGNGQVIVLCHDGKERLGFIRYKFSGRNKHGNLITCGCWVIIGCRSWETTLPDKLEKADLLEIYTHQEKTRLVQECKTNVSALLQYEQQQIMGGDFARGTRISCVRGHNLLRGGFNVLGAAVPTTHGRTARRGPSGWRFARVLQRCVIAAVHMLSVFSIGNKKIVVPRVIFNFLCGAVVSDVFKRFVILVLAVAADRDVLILCSSMLDFALLVALCCVCVFC